MGADGRVAALGDAALAIDLAGGDEWVMTYNDDLAASTLRAAAAWLRARQRPMRAPLEALEWERIRDLTANVFREVASA